MLDRDEAGFQPTYVSTDLQEYSNIFENSLVVSKLKHVDGFRLYVIPSRMCTLYKFA